MKILQLIPAFSDRFGGTTTAVKSISKELAKRHEVTVYTTTSSGLKHDFKPSIQEFDGYTVYYFRRDLKPLYSSGLFGQVNFSLGMFNHVRKYLPCFDIIHVSSWREFPDILVHYFAKKNILFLD